MLQKVGEQVVQWPEFQEFQVQAHIELAKPHLLTLQGRVECLLPLKHGEDGTEK